MADTRWPARDAQWLADLQPHPLALQRSLHVAPAVRHRLQPAAAELRGRREQRQPVAAARRPASTAGW
ncbi:hypothetical protein HBB16_10270 [Pseudonocardia sp. MCCB 268]|nr:hypothetical protein [Pseudonocardia cytotoxica]